MELRTKQRELFWLKLNRMLKLLPFLKLRALLIVVVIVVLSYFGRVEIVEAWKSLRDGVVGLAHDGSESVEKTVGATGVGHGSRIDPRTAADTHDVGSEGSSSSPRSQDAFRRSL